MPTKINPLGGAIPNLPHAISVSLPTWEDNIGYEEGEKRVVDAMSNGYPRFFIHLDIQALAQICEKKFGQPDERCMLFPAAYIATACRQFMIGRSPDPASPVPVRLAQYFICPSENESKPENTTDLDCVELHIVLFPAKEFSLAKQFWQHTGLGISSRVASAALALLARKNNAAPAPSALPLSPSTPPFSPRNKHYGSKSRIAQTPIPKTPPVALIENVSSEHDTYVEERYGRNLPRGSAALAKMALRRRIAGVLVNDSPSRPLSAETPELGASKRGVDVTENDVYLFPTGMAAIWTSHQLALAARPQHKSICFGFPYTDTLKILQKWGPGCHFFGRGVDSDIDELASILEQEPILALYTEFPSNPLLRCANLQRLRALADKYDFLIVVDETVGSFVNVEVLPYADIVVSSLSKVFSGEVNVMGGSLVLNPQGKHYKALQDQMKVQYEDVYWGEDSVFMERNSRDFIPRVHTINSNTEALCDFLRSRSLVNSSTPNTVVKEVYYPKWQTRENYDACRRLNKESPYPSGFSGLFSLTFTTIEASRAFFDNLDCAKGPSLGTNFTLACPYTILAHYAELDWAEAYGVETGLVRVSVGLEEREELLAKFAFALEMAEQTSAAA
ncbi:Cys/Met metabolism PLP-dependent enzyme [Ceratobasidium sp. AG-Ba]|nr:Cys/Met metabolism PLP-dependent enzyme [Ceratobasidium sp. AG-Ba]QRW05373.1 Cys/Met metabolism PLP-dependent enzyme [Ceratobasidium sp. AG-Ba]